MSLEGSNEFWDQSVDSFDQLDYSDINFSQELAEFQEECECVVFSRFFFSKLNSLILDLAEKTHQSVLQRAEIAFLQKEALDKIQSVLG